MFAGGVKFRTQKFDPEVGRINGGLLTWPRSG